ncbi:DNA glycosylase [Jackrogersella minutella]|nr:DNA glycosylase [Jackrogersella minutella]
MRRSVRISQQSASAVADDTVIKKTLHAEEEEKENEEVLPGTKPRKSRTKRKVQSRSDASDDDAEEYVDTAESPGAKRRKVASRSGGKNANAELYDRLFGKPDTGAHVGFPGRAHDAGYHRPQLLDSRPGRAALLDWFDGVSTARKMPWRKAWIEPNSAEGGGEEGDLRARLERRAYEVWISEIMLQQTRVAAVIGYWDRWMARWPTIQSLAAAAPDEVLAAWRGLGYYSRARRIHEAAGIVCGDEAMRGLLPQSVPELVLKVPGVGRYTAGAIAAIVFGRPAPMVDGNVLRVLSRQMGVLGDVKKDKGVVDGLWEAAERLVRAVARDSDAEEEEPSDRPGRWGQALMELGSTICIPKPNCAACPITSSCRAYNEGLQLAAKKGLAPKPTTPQDAAADIEDACTLCKPFEEFADEDDEAKIEEAPKQDKPKTRVQATLKSFAFTQATTNTTTTKSKKVAKQQTEAFGPAALEVITNHARKFPVRTAKKAVREEETLVCAIRRADGRYLLHRRPERGLLAGLWEMPSCTLKDPKSSSPGSRRRDAEAYVAGLIGTRVRCVDGLGSVPWLFSHLKLTMHVHLFDLAEGVGDGELEGRGKGTPRRWSDEAGVEEESMGTGMRKCWALVKEAGEG